MILIVAGAINALMYLISLYFQDPATFGMDALQAGLATLPAAAAMIAVTPLITPLAVKIGSRNAIAIGFGLAAAALLVLVFVRPSWTYAAFVLPLAVTAIGLGLANGPASSASTASVSPDQVGQASGISTWPGTSAARWRSPPPDPFQRHCQRSTGNRQIRRRGTRSRPFAAQRYS